ncbi:hypothetical protein [Rahnella aceris]|uniref:hypothetical protein n=1 Tax=Rahnella sp. (strain Y9602) TaxID=2703885 RepID=UPI000EB48C3C|nr:hypothetical protein BJ925_0025 [Rahnella aquatilis]
MSLVKYEDGIFTKNESRKTLYMIMAFSLALCIFVVIVNLLSFPKKKSNEWAAGYNHRQRFALLIWLL